jgi:hypothetical protein
MKGMVTSWQRKITEVLLVLLMKNHRTERLDAPTSANKPRLMTPQGDKG